MKMYYVFLSIGDGYNNAFRHYWLNEEQLTKLKNIVKEILSNGHYAEYIIIKEKEVVRR